MTETDVCNDALRQVGAERISSLDDNTQQGRDCKLFYASLRDSSLRRHYWNFATTRVQLQQITGAPVFGFTYHYQMPSDYLRMVNYTSSAYFLDSETIRVWPWEGSYWYALYRIEGDRLLSNDGEAYIEYIKRETNPDIWDPSFYQALVLSLASKLASSLMKNSGLSESKFRMAEIKWADAMAEDGQEGTPRQIYVPDLLVVRR